MFVIITIAITITTTTTTTTILVVIFIFIFINIINIFIFIITNIINIIINKFEKKLLLLKKTTFDLKGKIKNYKNFEKGAKRKNQKSKVERPNWKT